MHSKSVRDEALRLVSGGQSLNSVSKELSISRAAIREWRDGGVELKRGVNGCFRCRDEQPTDEAVYSRLFGFYLGDGCVSKTRSTYVLRVSCDAKYPGIIADVTRAVEGVHCCGSVCHVKAPGCVVVQNAWKHWPCVFPQHGPGRKHERKLILEAWQREITQTHPADFLRGLFHSDGCRAQNWTTRTVAGEKK